VVAANFHSGEELPKGPVGRLLPVLARNHRVNETIHALQLLRNWKARSAGTLVSGTAIKERSRRRPTFVQ